MEIIWNPQIQPNNKEEIEKYLLPYLWLVPKWVQKLYINLWDADKDAAISTDISYEYRRVSFDFYTCWLNSSPHIKQDNVIHEFIHCSVNPLFHQAREVAAATCKENEDLKDYAYEQLRISVESVTQDLTYAILSKFNE